MSAATGAAPMTLPAKPRAESAEMPLFAAFIAAPGRAVGGLKEPFAGFPNFFLAMPFFLKKFFIFLKFLRIHDFMPLLDKFWAASKSDGPRGAILSLPSAFLRASRSRA